MGAKELNPIIKVKQPILDRVQKIKNKTKQTKSDVPERETVLSGTKATAISTLDSKHQEVYVRKSVTISDNVVLCEVRARLGAIEYILQRMLNPEKAVPEAPN